MTQPFNLYLGDCLQVLKELSDNSIDSIVTDPPYGIKFMGKKWDCEVPSIEIWQECIRVLKPGGHLLAFAGTRTQHRMACNIEDAGFEIRDMIAWIYGSGFPKSHNLDGEWQGWGTALKPALEPITFARKPLIGTVAQNVELYGTGAINIDECRVQTDDQIDSVKNNNIKGNAYNSDKAGIRDTVYVQNQLGRFPANLIHDGSEEVKSYFPNASGQQSNMKNTGKCRQSKNGIYGGIAQARCQFVKEGISSKMPDQQDLFMEAL